MVNIRTFVLNDWEFQDNFAILGISGLQNKNISSDETLKAGGLTSAKDCSCLLDGLGHDTECVMQRTFGLIQDLLGGSTQDDWARLTQRHTCTQSNATTNALATKDFLFDDKLTKWRKLAAVTKKNWFWTKLPKFRICGKIFDEICIFDQRKMAFLAPKSGRDLEKALSHKFNHVTF